MRRNSTARGHSRRTFVKGMSLGASSLVLGSMLDRLALSAEGELPPPRFLFVLEGNGLPPEQVQPEGIPFVKREDRQAVETRSLAGLKLPAALAPVEAFKDRMAIIQGLSGRMCTGGHSSDHGALGAFYANNGRSIVDATVDAVLGQAYPGIFANLVLGIAADANESVIFNCSAAAPGRSLATICRPDIAYSRLFGSVARGQARTTFTARRNLLDYMRDDVRRVERRLSSADREKLDAYAGAFDSLSTTSQRLVEVRDRLGAAAPAADDKFSSDIETDRLDAHFELAAAAMIAGLTNVATIASGVGFPFFHVTFGGLNISQNKHSIGHGVRDRDNKVAWDLSETIRKFHFELIARFMRRLAEVPEGDGTMLDNTVVVYTSDAAETHHSQCFEWPFVVMGNARGRLRTDGRHVTYPDYGLGGHRAISALYNTLLHAAASPRDDFGRADPNLDRDMYQGTLGELLA